MAEYDDWFNVDDDGFQEKLQENRKITTLFTYKALVVFWKFLNWCKSKGSFLLPSFMFSSSDDLRNRDQRCQENNSYLETLFERILLGKKN
jgi:hypothetical protein